MKKIIISLAIVFAAVVSQAAATTWTINNIQSSPDVAVGAGWLVQIFDASVTYDYEKAKSGTIAATFTGASVQSGTTANFKATAKEGNFAPLEEVSLYAVIYDAATIADAKNYIVSDVVTKSVTATGADISHGFGSMASTATSNKFLNSSWTATGPSPTPEPTSAVLLLVGMAGLALRRKRA